MKKEQELAEKLAAQAFAKTYLQSLVPNVFMRLREDGLFLSPVRAGMPYSSSKNERRHANISQSDLFFVCFRAGHSPCPVDKEQSQWSTGRRNGRPTWWQEVRKID